MLNPQEFKAADSISPPAPESLLAAIIESSDDAILSKTLDGIITSWNRGAEHVFGYPSSEAIGRSIKILFPPERIPEEDDILQRIRRGERVDHFETVRRRKNGQLVNVSVTISPIRSVEGTIIGASSVARDISDQKLSGQAGLLLAAIVNSSEDAIVSKDLDGIITSWNAGAERIFGYSPAEAIGRPVLMLVPSDRKDEEPRILDRLRKGERMDHFETIRVRKDGELVPVSLTISPVRNPDGTIVGASKIARDISEVKRIAAEREQLLASERAARSQAERANRMKDEFLAIVSHELRTPLNAIVGWAQLLKEGGLPEEEVAGGIEVIERNARMQSQLIEDLLDLGRIAAGKIALNAEWIEIGAVVKDAIAAVRHTADSKNIVIDCVLNGARGGMMGDKQRLQQVVWNLLANAIKFTPKGGVVNIVVTRIDSRIEISVRDNGRGITPEFLPYVFDRFRQADSSSTRHYGGLGIGLALVRQLVELHGGTVRAESPGLNQGSTFVVSLPVFAARYDSNVAGISAASEHAMAPPSQTLAGIKVLVVDDDHDSLDVVQRILSSREAEVQTVSSVDQALAKYGSFRPDVILSDIGMPTHDGYDMIHRLRTLPGGRSTPAAAMTALVRPEDRMRALKAGFQTHVSKPVSPAELVAVVHSLAALRSEHAAD